MGRRSDHTSEELKELIINASIKLITEIGPSAFGTRAIAKEIGYSFGTIYHLFGDLENLRYHVKDRILENFYYILATGMEEVEDKSSFMVDTYIDFAEQQRFLWAFVFALPNDSKENLPDWYIETVEKMFSLLVKSFESVTHNKAAAEKAARSLWSGIHGICVLAMTHKLEMVTDETPREIAHEMLDVYVAGMKTLDGEEEPPTEAKAGNA